MLLLLLLSACQQDAAEERRPNVLFILVDDLGYHDLSHTGSRFYETPHIDSLARRSTAFTQGYASSRVCSPSRASLMLGQFTSTHGITDWIGALSGEDWRSRGRHDRRLPAEYRRSLPTESTTIAEAFQSAGYSTFFAGKWHLGGEGSAPEDHGFERNIGGWSKGGPRGGFFAPYDNPALSDGPAGESLTLRLGEETSRFITTQSDMPFFAMLSFYAVHAPLQTSRARWRKYRDKAETLGIADRGYEMGEVLPIRRTQDDPVYAGMVETVDDAVGRVLNTLRASGLDKNTIVIFTSDHGGVASGDNYATSNLPLEGGKGQHWEGGLRVPYFIHVPDASTSDRVSEVPVMGADLYPTLLDLCDITPNSAHQIDGVSLAPLLTGSVDSLPTRALLWHYPHYGNQGGTPSSIIRKGPWKLIHYHEDYRFELYHVPSDTSEQHDRFHGEPEVATRLVRQLMRRLARDKARLPQRDPLYDAAAAQRRRLQLEQERLPQLEAARRERLSESYQPNEDWWGSE